MFHIVIGLQARKLFILPTLALLVAVAVGAATLGLTQAQSSNGVYDTDGDKLIEISYLEQLFAIRYDLDGDGAVDKASDAGLYAQAFPVSAGQSVCDSDCEGYELTKSLNFRQTGSYQSGFINNAWTDTATSDGWTPVFHYGDARSIKGYNAIFDGNGNSIANLYSRYTPVDNDTGLFAVLESGATVRSLGLTGVNVIGDYSNTGALVGNNKGRVTGSYSTGGVSGDGNVGGLVGNNRGTVTQSYSSASVSSDEDYVGGLVGDNIGTISVSYAAGAVSGKKKYAGGLTGYNLGTVRNSYASGNVSGVSSVGGLVGKNTSKIEYSYAASSSVTGNSSVGGLVGSIVSGGPNTGSGSTITDGYWDTTVGPSSSSGGVGKTTSELISPTDYTGIYADWDDGDEGEVWDFGTSSQYPALKADLNGDGTATVAEFGSQQVTVSLPTPTPTPSPTATPEPLGSLTGVGGGASISGVGGNVSGGSISGGATGQSQSLPAIVLSTTTITVVEGSTASYTVKLNHEPYADVTVALSLTSLGIATADKYSLTFTSSNYSTAQTVTLSGTQDDDRYDDTVQVKHAASGGGYGDGTNVTANLDVTVDDDDNEGTLVASDATAITVLLTMSGYSGNWWYQRAGWSECLGPVTTSTYRVTGLQPNASSYINAYHTSSCGPNDGITQGNRFSTLAPTLSVSNVTASSVRLSISDEWDPSKDGPWRYGETGGICSGPTYDQNWTDVTTQNNTHYTFGAFSDSGCHVGVAPAITFLARDPSTLTASLPSARSVHLELTNPTEEWWYQRAGHSECRGPMVTGAVWLHGLQPNASMYVNAYHTSSCGPNDGLAQSNRFSTKNPTMTATNVTGDSATLTLSSEWASHDGNWHYKADIAPHTSCSAAQTGNSANISGLNPTTDYTYTAYLDSGCNTWADFATVDFTSGATFSVNNLSGAGAGDHAIGKSWNGSQSIHYTHATSFTTGSASNGYELKSVLIPFGQKVGINDFSMIVSVKNDDNGVPGDTDVIASGNFSGPSQVSNANGTYTCSGSCDLAASTTYHLVLSATHGSLNSSFFKWRATSSDDQSGPSGWSIGNDASRLVAGSSSWSSSASPNAGKFKLTAEEK